MKKSLVIVAACFALVLTCGGVMAVFNLGATGTQTVTIQTSGIITAAAVNGNSSWFVIAPDGRSATFSLPELVDYGAYNELSITFKNTTPNPERVTCEGSSSNTNVTTIEGGLGGIYRLMVDGWAEQTFQFNVTAVNTGTSDIQILIHG